MLTTFCSNYKCFLSSLNYLSSTLITISPFPSNYSFNFFFCSSDKLSMYELIFCESFLNYFPTTCLFTLIFVTSVGIGYLNFLAPTNLCPDPAEWCSRSYADLSAHPTH